MKPIHVYLIALVALGLGLGVGFLVGVRSAPEVPMPVIGDAGERDDGVKPEPENQPERLPPAPPAQPTVEPPPAGEFAAWMSGLSGETPGEGTGRISGVAVLEDNTPLVGVTVTATPRWRAGPTSGKANSLEESVAEYARKARFEHAGKVSAATDSKGRYELSGLGEYDYQLVAERPGVRFTRPTNSYRAQPGDTVDFVGVATCMLDLDIRMPDGTQPDRASYSIRYERQSNSSRSSGGDWNPGSTKREVEPGELTISATAGEHRQYLSDWQELELKLGEETKVTLNLKAQPGFLCRVIVPAEMPNSRWMSVSVHKDPPEEPPQTTRASGQSETLHRGRDVAFTGLEAGRWRLIVAQDGKVLVWQDETLGPDEFREVTLTVPPPKAEDHIVVRVYDPTGNPIEATFNVGLRGESRHGGSSHSGGGSQAVKRKDGSYWIERYDPDRRNEGYVYAYEITVNAKGYGALLVSYPHDATHELRVDMQTPGTLMVHLPGATTHPLRRELRTRLMRKTGDTSWSQVAGSEKNLDPRNPEPKGLSGESEEFGPLSPGTYRFGITFVDSKDTGMSVMHATVAEWTFDVRAGANTQTCPVPALYTLTLLVSDPGAIRRMTLSRGGDGNRMYIDEIRQRTVVRCLTAGEWVIDTREGEMRVRIDGDTEVALTAKPYNAVRIIGLVPGGKVEGMGLRSGDLVVVVDEEELEGSDRIELLLRASMLKESTTWVVLRNGVRTDVTFNGKELMAILEKRGPDREHIDMRPATRD